MTQLAIKTITGDDAGTYDLDDALLEREKGEQAIHDTVVAYLAAQRQGNASTKTRGNVSGGGAKPYRQKGTGNARAGSNRSPIWRGGGTIFGPLPRDYTKKVNKKVRTLAMRRALTDRIDAGQVIVLDNIELDSHKTKTLADVLKAVGAGNNALIIDAEVSGTLIKASGNMPKVETATASDVNVYQVLLHRLVITTSAGLDKLSARLKAKAEVAK
jgi:large subunit ribosomal protein L4